MYTSSFLLFYSLVAPHEVTMVTNGYCFFTPHRMYIYNIHFIYSCVVGGTMVKVTIGTIIRVRLLQS